MRERTDQIETQIREERDELRANLDELGAQVRSVTDWRRQFRKNPMLGLGLAFGAGLLLAGLSRGAARTPSDHASDGLRPGRRPLSSAWEGIQGALVGVATTKVSDVLGELVPGFREHLAKASPATYRSGRSGNGDGVQGEGDYEAARRYRAGAERYARSADVAAAARAAEPHTEAEAEELKVAEELGRARGKA
jgi:hypothetical protein